MTSTGIRNRRTTDDRTDDTVKQQEDSYIRKAKRFTDQGRAETGNAGPGAIGGASIPGASYLPISGKYGMIGSIAFSPIALVIDDGRINITPNESGASQDSSYVLVTAQGSPDDLRFIDGASKNGQIMWLQGTLTQIINLKAATISGIDTISGLVTVTVVTTSNHNLTTNDKINILATTNFNVNDVTVTVIGPTTFTYSAVGNITPESAGFVQNGNFVTDTGDDVILDGTKSTNGVPMIPIIFDPTVAGNGAWRPAQLVSVNGGGVSFPARPPVDNRGLITTNQNFILSNSTGHVLKMELGANINITFNNFPIVDEQQEWEVELKQDVTGGRVVTWPVNVVNPPVIDVNPEVTTIVVFRTNDAGATIRVGNTVTTSLAADLSLWANFPAITNIDANDNDIVKVKNIDFDDVLSTMFGLVDLQWFQGGHQFTSVSGIFNYRVDTNDIHQFHAGASPILEMSNATGLKMLGTTHPINLNNNEINAAKQIEYNISNTFNPTIETVMGFDFTSKSLKTNVGLVTDIQQWYASGELLMSLSRFASNEGLLDVKNVQSDTLIANKLIDLATFNNTGPANGNIWLDSGTGNFKFRQNGTTFELNAGSGANTTLSNLVNPTAVNQDINMLGKFLTLDSDKDTYIESFTDDNLNTVVGGSVRSTVTNTNFLMAVELSLLNLNKITNVVDPTSPQDVVTQNFFVNNAVANPLSADLNFNGNDATGVDDIFFSDTDMSIQQGSGIMSIRVGVTDTIRLRLDTTSGFIYNSLGIQFGNTTNLGVFGNSPLPQQTAPTDTLANLYTIFRAYGWIA